MGVTEGHVPTSHPYGSRVGSGAGAACGAGDGAGPGSPACARRWQRLSVRSSPPGTRPCTTNRAQAAKQLMGQADIFAVSVTLEILVEFSGFMGALRTGPSYPMNLADITAPSDVGMSNGTAAPGRLPGCFE